MKMVVAYVDPDRFEPIREDLLEMGFVSLTVSEASGSTPEPTMTGSYRGAKMERHVRAKARIECVLGDDQAQTVVEAMRRLGGEHTFVIVLPVEGAVPDITVKSGELATA
jgi:nitrogen regulatory protein P-II 1